MRKTAIAAMAATNASSADMEIETADDGVVMRLRCGDDVMEMDLTVEQAINQAATLMLAALRATPNPDKVHEMFMGMFRQRMAEMMHGRGIGQG